jgi:hypothetical protein
VLPLQAKKKKKKKKKTHRFCRHNDIEVLRDLCFSQNQPLKSADGHWNIAIYNKNLQIYRFFVFFQLVLIFPVTQLDAGSEILT